MIWISRNPRVAQETSSLGKRSRNSGKYSRGVYPLYVCATWLGQRLHFTTPVSKRLVVLEEFFRLEHLLSKGAKDMYAISKCIEK